MKLDKQQDAAQKMLELYNNAPFPDVMQGMLPDTNVLLLHWIAAAAGRQDLGKKGSKILMAGCGSGAEALVMSQLYPEAEIIGIDFSEKSIEKAKQLAIESGNKNLSFFTADLMRDEQCLNFGIFDLIVCHGVADYVSDAEQLFRTFNQCLKQQGVICMTVNSPNHPASRIRAAFKALGVNPIDFDDNVEQRKMLQLIDRLMANDSGLKGIGNASKSYLDVDIFAPIAHHDNISDWSKRAEDSGLYFAGSMDALLGLVQVSDPEVHFLLALGKAELSVWMSQLCKRPGIQMLFVKEKTKEPDFGNLSKLLEWRPKLDNCLGALPELSGPPDEPKLLTIRFQGLPDFIVNSTAYELELLRNCDGQNSLGEIISNIPAQGNPESLSINLYRLYQYGLLV